LKNGLIFARAEMGPFFKGWIPADFHVPDRGTSRQKKMHFALSQFRNGFAERCKHTRLIQLSPRRAKRALPRP
jgi:hypothetical protein